MITFIIIILSIAAGIFIALYLFLRRDLKNLAKSLGSINSIDTNSRLRLASRDCVLNSLAIEINKSLKEKKDTEAEYKRMDMELRQAIANISHDLRTPLTSIMGYLQLIEDESLPPEERKEYMDIVKLRSKDLKLLIEGFYELSRLESGEYSYDLKSISLYNILCDTAASYYNDFTAKGLEPEISLQENIKPIISDENAVRRIFSNLLQNMLKYGEKQAAITLKQEKGYISTAFSNGAPDLKEEDIPKLFERFFTGDRSRNGRSTGLGLSITKQLVEQLGHEISAELHEGRLVIEIKWNISNK